MELIEPNADAACESVLALFASLLICAVDLHKSSYSDFGRTVL